MSLSRPLVVAAAALTRPALAAALAAAVFAPTAWTQSVSVAGSSTVEPISSAVAEAFIDDNDAEVTVKGGGTGTGFSNLAAGEIDIADASRSVKPNEHAALVAAGIDYIEIPVAYDGLSIVVHKGNTWADELTVEQIRLIFTEGGATNWKQVDPAFPDLSIKIYAPGEASGTYDYFKEVISGKNDKHGSLRSDMSKSEEDNVLVTGVSGNRGAIGFFGVAYYEANTDQLNAVKVINDAGEAVGPEPETIEDGSYNPFSRPLFIYANAKSLQRPEVRQFIDFYFDEGPELVEEVGYVRLPESVYEAGKKRVAERTFGSAFLDAQGNALHGSVVDLYR